MEFFDTHSHYNDEAYDEDRKEIIEQIHKEGITKTVVIGYNIEKSKKAIEIANDNEFIYAAIGIHPSDIGKTEQEILLQIEKIKEILYNKKVVAIGEIGLDYHWEKENIELQKFAFTEQIKLANKLRLPIVIHSRDAIMDTIEILKGKEVPKYSGILHCCVLNKDLIQTGIDAGLYISFAGPITFKNTKNTELINIVPEDRLLIETDCPYLSPEPNRGKRNDSKNIKYTAQKIAEIRGKTTEDIAQITYRNAEQVYNIKNKKNL